MIPVVDAAPASDPFPGSDPFFFLIIVTPIVNRCNFKRILIMAQPIKIVQFRQLPFQDPDGEIENSGKSIFEIRIQNFCYIQVIVFGFSYLSLAAVGTGQVRNHEKIVKNRKGVFRIFFMVADLLSPNRCNWQIAKIKNYNLNVTEVQDPDFPMLFPGIFNFTVGILIKTNLCQLNEG